MTTGLVETVNVDGYEDVVVLFDYEDDKYYINEVWKGNVMIASWKNIDGDLLRDILCGLEARREHINSDIEQYNNED